MFEFYPYRSNDASTGLFSPSDNDVYHSAEGALSEAYAKFIIPANIPSIISKKSCIKVLDICYGIGYNTKAFLNFILNLKDKNFLKILNNKEISLSSYNDKIYDDNNYVLFDNIDTLYSDNIVNKNSVSSCKNKKLKFKNLLNEIYIKAIDTNENFGLISPFINSKISENYKNNNLNFNYEKIEKILKNNKNEYKNDKILKYLMSHSYLDLISYYLCITLYNKYKDKYKTLKLRELFSDEKYKPYFNQNICRLFENLINQGVYEYPMSDLNTFLHNIYYKYLTTRYKNGLNSLKIPDINFDIKFNDARSEILADNNIYDLIFLDAFTPSKCPCLWSYEFFKLLYEHLDNDGLILTYSTSAPVRNAMLKSGFNIGYIKNETVENIIGTIASKNSDCIKYDLSEFDLSLVKSKSGIIYRDENLSASNEAILKARELEVSKSNLISVSQLKKHYNL